MYSFSHAASPSQSRDGASDASSRRVPPELFSVEQLMHHAASLAARHPVGARQKANPLLDRLTAHEDRLRGFLKHTQQDPSGRHLTPAAEWLLDNFYLIEEQIQLARKHLPRDYSRQLPCLMEGTSKGLPRIYDVVTELVSHQDAQVDAETLSAFVASYQSVTLLKLGELWAIPIMLRLSLIDTLQQIARRLLAAREDRALANEWIDRLQTMAERDPSQLVVVVADMARAEIQLTCAFVAEFTEQLARQNPLLHLARSWMEQHLAQDGRSVESLCILENQQQSANQMTVSHCIASLRFLSTMDWEEFVETLSGVEEILRGDPSGIYRRMDFSTRDRYRHAVEILARQSGKPEKEVAKTVLRISADHARTHGADDRRAHVGYVLIDRGLPDLRKTLRARASGFGGLEAAVLRNPLRVYLGTVSLFTFCLTAGVVWIASAGGLPAGLLGILTVLVLVCGAQLAVSLVNALIPLLVKPRPPARLDFAKGIASECRTMVVIPSMLTTPEGIQTLLETLEVHHLSNPDAYLHFALLTDFRDAPGEQQPGDDELVRAAAEGVDLLNQKYAEAHSAQFFLFHRPRVWNSAEGVWMGYERKRGKLEAFNSFLRGGSQTAYSEVRGETAVLSAVRYVITLDTDTRMPRDAARTLIATLAHPLNRAVFDPTSGQVVDGYTILQPRVSASLPGARRSWYVRLFGGDAGIDPYTREVSDVYQDLFAEGSYIGKGIYEVDAFVRSLHERFPDNSILSHDLLEGCCARSGLVSDVEVYEDDPSRYAEDMARRHRWIRGDWQMLPRTLRARLSPLSRWKLFDNLRRSLVSPANLLLILFLFFLVPNGGLSGAVAALVLVGLSGLLSALSSLPRKSASIPWRQHLRAEGKAALRLAGRTGFTLAMMPHETLTNLDAVFRTCYRVFVSRKHLLEWQTSGDAALRGRDSLPRHFRTMAFSPVLALITAGILALWAPANLPGALPVLLLWILAPGLAWKCSQSLSAKQPGLSAEQIGFLGECARKTWSFFETFVTAEENWLPPDNFQEAHGPRIAHRTSPTNMGLSLLANLAARDFGYLTLGGLAERTRNSLATFDRMPRKHGHFYNWYDTRSLEPLLPIYLSSVDSGNLAGHLLTLGSGLRGLADEPLFSERIFSGLRDTLHVLTALAPDDPVLQELGRMLSGVPDSLSEGLAHLEQVKEHIQQLSERVIPLSSEQEIWFQRLQETAEAQLRELRDLMPEPADSLDPTLRQQSARGVPAAVSLMTALEELADRADAFAQMDFTFLYDKARDLFRTGYNLSERRFDTGYYDLLASEARLGSYVAVALGQIPQKHWFTLSRLLVSSNRDPILVSWSGSMFEYLMPNLVMPSHEKTLLDHSCRAAVAQQVDYGHLRKVPWGISESGYNRTDIHLNYQYRAFGSPGIGLKRGLAEDLVIAPYASVMALMISPRLACENLQRLRAEGREGEYGFYEAVDYTPSRQLPNEKSATLLSYMAHHQGMSLLALLSFLRGQPMQKRFMNCPPLKATGFLLQERVPKTGAGVLAADLDLEDPDLLSADKQSTMRVMPDPAPVTPEVHLLSNGSYHVLISSAGAGSSRWRDLAVTRWREDATRDCWGLFVYLRDVDSGDMWSAAHQPTRVEGQSHEAIFSQARAEFKQRHHGIAVHTELCVSPEDDVEVRRITLTNNSRDTRRIELTSYGEVVLAPAAADASHPAFSNLFVQTEFTAATSSLLCTRRPRSVDETPPWLLHLFVGHNGDTGEVSCETDRARFIGRGGSLTRPLALRESGPLSNTVGSVLDPVVSLRRIITLAPRQSSTVHLVLGVCETREIALSRVEQYQSPRMSNRAFDLAWTHSQVTLHHLNITEAEAQVYGHLTSALIYADPARRTPPGVLRQNRRGQTGLWSYGISGDSPIILLRISDINKIDLVQQAIRAHAYWRTKGLTVELVILNGDHSVYHQSLHQQITERISSGVEAKMLDQRGGIFLRRLDQIPQEDLVLLQAVARVVLEDNKGSFQHQVERHRLPEPDIPLLVTERGKATFPAPPLAKRDLLFHNGCGGFTRDGREYVITLQPGQHTPAPWINVIANRTFGTVVSESGGGYTWIENAHEFRITPWNNDSVRDTPGEAFYLRDEQSGQVWSPTPGPARGNTPYVIRHGFGYTVFEHQEHGIASELWIYVAMDAPVKFATLKLRNLSGQSRRLSATGYWEWVLGDLRAKSLMHVQTEIDSQSGALLARNTYNNDFMDRIAFLDVDETRCSLTADRREFIGRNGSLAQPAALTRGRLSGNVGAGLDPCGAIQVSFELADGQSRETTFRLGVGRDKADATTLIRRYRQPHAGRKALEGVWEYWNRTLGAVNLDTPDPAVNLMANGWLLYQTLSCRMWGRSGFYQSGGAYGFRDQLQDSLALVHSEPALIRGHLLLAAAHQFVEGDVQHWWHPPSGRGVRTHFSDDYLWLPFVTCHYVTCVGDSGVLDEIVPFLEGRPVNDDEEAYFDQPQRSEERASLYEHCVRAIENGLNFGQHGLPLIGCGDWNDGMNQVGPEGKGESVWLAFFLFDVLHQFADLADTRQDEPFAARCREQASQLQKNIEANAWDGGWYKRAWFDNGVPLGSAQSPECQIDSLPQSWSVLSGAGDPARSKEAMAAVNERLVRREDGLIQLFDPPFDTSDLEPGYIKGYIPGVRENGGQYTHAAIWTAMAFAKLGDTDRAWELFNLLNPVHHGDSPEAIATYKVEPYVAVADIYGEPPHIGRGGWTWYTGSAGWMYRLLVETLLGIHKQGDRLHFRPLIPKTWPGYKVHYRYHQTVYHITLTRDPAAPEPAPLHLQNDRREHHVEVRVRG
ncbi:MAG: cyclic beta 1-2 glucan synthetase [Kiritimatiellae bacterium]|nr:cyclic beta 1-2 glucan synthetase [Kiritimatiellia bacterium]